MIELDDERADHLTTMWDSPLQHANNMDYGGNAGVHAGISLEGGMGILAGVDAEGEISYTYEVSHRLFESEDTESSTSITVEFGDSQVGDEFLVDIWLDRECHLMSLSTWV